MKRKLSNQFLADYLIIFVLTLSVTGLALVFLNWGSQLISERLAKNNYPARAIMEDDYRLIDPTAILKAGGGVQIIDKNYRVRRSEGYDTIGKSQLTTAEWTDFLIKSQDTSSHYDIRYNPQGEFWLIVSFPTSLRIDFSFVSNKEALVSDLTNVIGVIITVFSFYLVLIGLITFMYSRMTAARITTALEKFARGTRRLRAGDYSL